MSNEYYHICGVCDCGRDLDDGDCVKCGFNSTVCPCGEEDKLSPKILTSVKILQDYFRESLDTLETLEIELNKDDSRDIECQDEIHELIHDYTNLEEPFERQNTEILRHFQILYNYRLQHLKFTGELP